jgi:hypothetical protein
MTTTNHRHERVGEEIAHEINAMLAGELKDPRLEGSVVVSEVRVQPDMKHARVYVTVKGSNKEQSDAIQSQRIDRAAATAPLAGDAFHAGHVAGARRAHRAAFERDEERQARGIVGLKSLISRLLQFIPPKFR